MAWFFSVCCFAVCFTPSLVVFRRLVAPDPLRIILFVLGAFFWLLSLALASTIHALLGPDWLLVPITASILFQEAARALYFVLMYKAQNGLARLAAGEELAGGADARNNDPTSASYNVNSPGARFVHSSRHILAIVCGLGMGTMAALFLLTNILAAHWDQGVVGLPAEADVPLPSSTNVHLRASDAYFPLFYSISCGLLVLFNVCWTVCVWDAFHRWFHKLGSQWFWISTAVLTLCSHFLNTLASYWLSRAPLVVLPLQMALLGLIVALCVMLIRKTNGGGGGTAANAHHHRRE